MTPAQHKPAEPRQAQPGAIGAPPRRADIRQWNDRGTMGQQWIADRMAEAGMTGTPAERGSATEAPMVIDAEYIDGPPRFAGLQQGDVLSRWHGEAPGMFSSYGLAILASMASAAFIGAVVWLIAGGA